MVTPLSHEEGQKALRLARQALLNNTNGFIARQKLRLRLFFMGKVRPMKIDDAMALISWIFVSQTVFVLVGTTTFVSILLFLANTLSFQEYLGSKVCNMLTNATGYNISFKTAIVPRWREGTIRLESVKIVCNADSWIALCLDQAAESGISLSPVDIDINFTYCELKVNSIDLTLSLWRWLDGRGIIKSIKLTGVRGEFDRRHIRWDDDWAPSRRCPQFGDFNLEGFVIKDALVTIRNPNFRSFQFSIYNAQMDSFRQQWMFYDLLCARSIVGTFDDCLFSVHKPQTNDLEAQKTLESNWSKISNLKMYGLPIDHFNNGVSGPVSWITKGTVDLDLHFLVPPNSQDDDLLDKILDEVDGLREIARNKLEFVIPNSQNDSKPLIALKDIRHYGLQHAIKRKNAETSVAITEDAVVPLEDSSIVIFVKAKLKDLKASVPLTTPELSYMSNALIRPIVGYMNSNRTLIPLMLSAKMDRDNFNGAADIYSSGLADVMAEETGRAMSELVNDEKEYSRRLRQIGYWGISELSQGMLNFLEYVRGDRGFSIYNGSVKEEEFWYAEDN